MTPSPGNRPSMRGQLALILHAHLPYVRHPGHDRFYEEQWLFEAVAESYLPLLGLMRGWSEDGLDWRLSLTLTPPLCAMLEDRLLRSRIERYLMERAELAASDALRWHLVSGAREAAEFARDRYRTLLRWWDATGGELLPLFRQYSNSGHLEILCCSATHAFLPFLAQNTTALAAQIELGVAEHQRHFGRRPSGIWLPECAYAPDLDQALVQAGLEWFPVESHAFRNASPLPRAATFKPVVLPSGLAAFARDASSARQVWSRDCGYPGDPRYREFHRDIADDCDWEYVQRYLPGTENRVSTGIKLHRVTGRAGEKEWYDRGQALAATREHARHFVAERLATCEEAWPLIQDSPLITAPYDAELFGHWWFEGPEFIDEVVRSLTAPDSRLRMTTPSEYLSQSPRFERCQIAASTWGQEGYASVWLNSQNAWIQPRLRALEPRMCEMVSALAASRPVLPYGAVRCLNQAARELLLAQASDWPFLIKMETAGDYPTRRAEEHLTVANRLLDQVEQLIPFELDFVMEREKQYPIFPEIDALSLFRSRK